MQCAWVETSNLKSAPEPPQVWWGRQELAELKVQKEAERKAFCPLGLLSTVAGSLRDQIEAERGVCTRTCARMVAELWASCHPHPHPSPPHPAESQQKLVLDRTDLCVPNLLSLPLICSWKKFPLTFMTSLGSIRLPTYFLVGEGVRSLSQRLFSVYPCVMDPCVMGSLMREQEFSPILHLCVVPPTRLSPLTRSPRGEHHCTSIVMVQVKLASASHSGAHPPGRY